MAAHSGILAWKIPQTEETGGRTGLDVTQQPNNNIIDEIRLQSEGHIYSKKHLQLEEVSGARQTGHGLHGQWSLKEEAVKTAQESAGAPQWSQPWECSGVAPQ